MDPSVLAYEAHEQFEGYRRPANLSIKEYSLEFEKKVAKLKASGTVLADNILCYRLLKSANLSDSELQLVKEVSVNQNK